MEIIRGKYSEWKDVVKTMAKEHFAEVGVVGTDNLPLVINDEYYQALEDANQLLGLLIIEREEEKVNVVGYLSIFIYQHQQHQGTMFAQTDGFFVHPKYRGFKTFNMVCKMFKKAETILKKEYGVDYLYLGVNASNELDLLVNYLDFKKSTILYLKRLA